MKYKILKKAIRINKYSIENNKFILDLSLESHKIELLRYTVIVNNPSENLYSNIRNAILIFKETKEYKEVESKIDREDIVIKNDISIEYDLINDLSDVKYFNAHYPDMLDDDYKAGKITRYIAKFLNHNYLIEISKDDYSNIINKNENTHFEAYDVATIDWKLVGSRDEIFLSNNNELNKLKVIFGDFNTFYGLNEFDSGPYYLTIYDEIPKLYTIGGELIYEDTLTNYSGYYHYIKGRLWSGISDSTGPNRLLLEEVSESVGDDLAGLDIVDDVNQLINMINDEMKKYPGALSDLENQLNGLVDGFGNDLQNSINEFLDGSDLKDLFNESVQDVLDIQNDPNAQAKIEKKYEDKLDNLPLSKDDKNKVKKKGPKMPKIKIPNVHLGRKPHDEGKDHNYELGF